MVRAVTMVGRIEDYALIGDTHTAALVGRDGSIDWLCLPALRLHACFAALLGGADHGRWLLAPAGGIQRVERSYRDRTLVLETTFHTDSGVVRVIDCMPIRKRYVNLVRVVEGVSGRVPMHMDLRIRFGYGSVLPWVVQRDGRLHATSGPNTAGPGHADRHRRRGRCHGRRLRRQRRSERVPFVLTWHPSYERAPASIDADRAMRRNGERGGVAGRSSAPSRHRCATRCCAPSSR